MKLQTGYAISTMHWRNKNEFLFYGKNMGSYNSTILDNYPDAPRHPLMEYLGNKNPLQIRLNDGSEERLGLIPLTLMNSSGEHFLGQCIVPLRNMTPILYFAVPGKLRIISQSKPNAKIFEEIYHLMPSTGCDLCYYFDTDCETLECGHYVCIDCKTCQCDKTVMT